MPLTLSDIVFHSSRRYLIRIGLMTVSVIALALTGCVSPKPQLPIPPPLTLDQLLARYNERVHSVPAFQAKIKEWEVNYQNEPDQPIHHKDMYGHAVYQPPSDAAFPYASCYIEARTLLDPELIMGCNSKEYWIAVKRAKQAHWGKYEHLDKPCADAMSFHPQLFLEIAGLRPLPLPGDSSAQPLLKVTGEHYIIEYLQNDEYGLWIKKEFVIDRRTDLPIAVHIYDPTGKRVIDCEISDYQSLDTLQLPGELSLTADNGDFQFRLVLGGFKILKKDRSQLFIRPEHIAGISDYQQIDIHCENNTP